jgi:hypothetical protein
MPFRHETFTGGPTREHYSAMAAKTRVTRSQDPVMQAIDRVMCRYMMELVDEVGGQSPFSRRTKIGQPQISRWGSGDRPVSWLQLVRVAEANLVIGGKPMTIDRLLSEIAVRIWEATRPEALRRPVLEREALSGESHPKRVRSKEERPTTTPPPRPRTPHAEPSATHDDED